MMRTYSALILLALQSISIIAAVPLDDAPIQNFRPAHPGAIELEFGKEYSEQDLHQLNPGAGLDPTNDAGIGKVVNPKFVSSSPLMDSAIQNNAVPNKWAMIQYDTACPVLKTLRAGSFAVDVGFDGKVVTYKKLDNSIDGFGETTVGGGYGKPITSTAEFHRESCWYIPESGGHMCAYHFHGTVKAAVTVIGKDRGIKVDAYGPKEGPATRTPFVTENCIPSPKGQTRPKCPSSKGPRCTINSVSMLPIHG